MMDAHNQTCLFRLIQFYLTLEITAVYKGNAIAVSVILSGIAVAENDRRIVVVAGHASLALNGLDAMEDRAAFDLPLHVVPSVKMNQVQGTFGKVQL